MAGAAANKKALDCLATPGIPIIPSPKLKSKHKAARGDISSAGVAGASAGASTGGAGTGGGAGGPSMDHPVVAAAIALARDIAIT